MRVGISLWLLEICLFELYVIFILIFGVKILIIFFIIFLIIKGFIFFVIKLYMRYRFNKCWIVKEN